MLRGRVEESAALSLLRIVALGEDVALHRLLVDVRPLEGVALQADGRVQARARLAILAGGQDGLVEHLLRAGQVVDRGGVLLEGVEVLRLLALGAGLRLLEDGGHRLAGGLLLRREVLLLEDGLEVAQRGAVHGLVLLQRVEGLEGRSARGARPALLEQGVALAVLLSLPFHTLGRLHLRGGPVPLLDVDRLELAIEVAALPLREGLLSLDGAGIYLLEGRAFGPELAVLLLALHDVLLHQVPVVVPLHVDFVHVVVLEVVVVQDLEVDG